MMRCRVTDAGLHSGSDNVAMDAAMLEACARDGQAALRFHRYRRTASIGAGEEAGLAVREDYCAANDIPVVRRVSGGGALFLDPGQLWWTLTFRLRPRMPVRGIEALMAYLCGAVASALQCLGVDARYRYPNDIEIGDRKIASGFMAIRGDVLLFQGGVLRTVDTAAMLRALRVPTEKLTPAGIRSARERLVTLDQARASAIGDGELRAHLMEAFGDAAGLYFQRDGVAVAAAPHASANRTAPNGGDWHEYGAMRAWVKTTGGVLYAALAIDAQGHTFSGVRLAGGVHVRPPNALDLIAEGLRGTYISDLETTLRHLFREHRIDGVGLGHAEVSRALQLALARVQQRELLGLDTAQANTLMVHGGEGAGNIEEILARASVMLVPYCAKPPHCRWRNMDGCPECGGCEVGDAYRLARERGMTVISINNFEHLQRTLDDMRAQGVRAYVGMCCEHFYLKRHHAFERAGMPAVLMDIAGSNCYELQQEERAYAGTFEAQSRLNLDVVEKVMQRVVCCRQAGVRGAAAADRGPVERRSGATRLPQ